MTMSNEKQTKSEMGSSFAKADKGLFNRLLKAMATGEHPEEKPEAKKSKRKQSGKEKAPPKKGEASVSRRSSGTRP